MQYYVKNKKYTAEVFSLHGFIIGNTEQQVEKIKNNDIGDCCYLTKYLFPENRTNEINNNIKIINIKRNKIGIDNIEDMTKKNIFNRKNNGYIFPDSKTNIHGVETNEDADNWKKRLHLIKL